MRLVDDLQAAIITFGQTLAILGVTALVIGTLLVAAYLVIRGSVRP